MPSAAIQKVDTAAVQETKLSSDESIAEALAPIKMDMKIVSAKLVAAPTNVFFFFSFLFFCQQLYIYL